MSDLRQTPHSVPRGKLPEIDASTSLQEVYAYLGAAGRSGFFLKDGGAVTAYVKAYDLGAALFPRGGGGGDAARSALTTRPIGDVLREHPEFMIRVQPRLVTPREELEPLRQETDAVFGVVAGGPSLLDEGRRPEGGDDARSLEGWLLNHETLVATSTRRLVWKCENPAGAHANPDPDHGTCYACPFPTALDRNG